MNSVSLMHKEKKEGIREINKKKTIETLTEKSASVTAPLASMSKLIFSLPLTDLDTSNQYHKYCHRSKISITFLHSSHTNISINISNQL